MEAVTEYKNMGYKVALYPNRLEVVKKSILGGSKETIILRSITQVELPLGRPLEITTVDGKKHRLNLLAGQAKDLQSRLLELV